MLLLSLLTFTPLIIPAGKIDPMLFGIPYTLWLGMLIAALMILITVLATFVHPDRDFSAKEQP